MLRSTILSQMSKALSNSKFRLKQLQELESAINWADIEALVEPHYASSSLKLSMTSVKTMIRIYFLQLRYGLSSSDIEESLFEIETLRKFALITDAKTRNIPNEAYIDGFSQLIAEKDLNSDLIKAFDSQK